eukprot:sb/3466373/
MSDVILRKIEDIVLEMIRDLSENRSPRYTMVSLAKSNVSVTSEGISIGSDRSEVEMFGRRGGNCTRFSKVTKILAYVYKLVKNGGKVTQRDAYYTLTGFFSNQAEFNSCFEDVLRMLDVPRRSLGITAAPKGSIAGAIVITQSTETIDCLSLGKDGFSLPGDPGSLEFRSLGARYILIVEKDAVFRTLCEKVLWNSVPVIMITGRGYPCLAVREVASRLEKQFSLPVLGLFDYNPHGLQILMTYKFGSTRMGREGVEHRCNIRWLGLHSSDVQGVVGEQVKSFTDRDGNLCRSLLNHPYIEEAPSYRREVEEMEKKAVKIELEAISDLKEFVVNKILKRRYF